MISLIPLVSPKPSEYIEHFNLFDYQICISRFQFGLAGVGCVCCCCYTQVLVLWSGVVSVREEAVFLVFGLG